MGKGHNLRLVTEPDPTREELRSRIQSFTKAEREYAIVTAAWQVADDRLHAAYQALDQATAAAALLRPKSAGHRLADELMGAPGEADIAERAHAAVESAHAELEAVKGALEILKLKREVAAEELTNAKFYRSTAVARVVKASEEIRAVVASYHAAKRELDHQQQILATFGYGMLPDGPATWNPDGSLVEKPPAASPAAAAWKSAISALATDADAALPEAR